MLAAEVAATTNDQPHFVPITTAVIDNLAEAGHRGGAGAFVAMWATGLALTALPTSVPAIDRHTKVVVA